MYNTDMPTRAELPTNKQLLRSSAIAAVSAVAILVAVVLPSEYGVDPTGIGSALNLTEMGEIKMQLAAEAEADAAMDAANTAAPSSPAGANAATLGSQPNTATPPAVAPVAPPSPPAPAAPERQSGLLGTIGSFIVSSAYAQEMRQDEMTITLEPGQGAEVKVTMQQGQITSFAWAATEGAIVNVDTHGDGGGQSVSYSKERAISSGSGQLTAAFTGNHGWFWRNRGDAPISLTVRVVGPYSAFERKA